MDLDVPFSDSPLVTKVPEAEQGFLTKTSHKRGILTILSNISCSESCSLNKKSFGTCSFQDIGLVKSFFPHSGLSCSQVRVEPPLLVFCSLLRMS